MKYAALLFLSFSAFAQDLYRATPLESFLHTAASRSRIPETQPSVQAALGFTDSEMQSLNEIARAFAGRPSLPVPPSSEMVFQARLDLADTGKESETLKQFFEKRDAERDAAVARAAQLLRTALGEERYRKLDAWLQGGGATGCWAAPCPAPKR